MCCIPRPQLLRSFYFSIRTILYFGINSSLNFLSNRESLQTYLRPGTKKSLQVWSAHHHSNDYFYKRGEIRNTCIKIERFNWTKSLWRSQRDAVKSYNADFLNPNKREWSAWRRITVRFHTASNPKPMPLMKTKPAIFICSKNYKG